MYADEEHYYNNKISDESIKWTDRVYVLDWASTKNQIYAFGVDESGDSAKLMINNVKTSLFVFAENEMHLTPLLNLRHVDLERPIRELSSFNFEIPNNTLLDTLIQTTSVQYKTFQVPTCSFGDSQNLHKLLNTTALKNHIKTTATWSLELLIVFEMACRTSQASLEECSVYDVFVDANLARYEDLPKPKIDIVAFDIETLSSFDYRLPLGDYKNDILFSASIKDHGTNTMYSFVNIPVPVDFDYTTTGSGTVAKRARLEQTDTVDANSESVRAYTERLKSLMERDFEATRNMQRKLVVVHDEVDLIRLILQTLDRKRLYFLLGYNSKGYDMTFLIKRTAYLCLPEFKNFTLYRGMPVYGNHMIHIDLIKIFRQLYPEVGKLSLDTMAKLCLGQAEGKVEFNAINIRHVYRQLLERGLPNDECHFEKFNIDLATIVHYNDVDTELLCRLWDSLSYDEFLPKLCKSHLISIVRYTQCKIGEFINNKSVYSSLTDGKILTLHKSIGGGLMITTNGSVMYTYNQNQVSAGVNEASYGGGFNMRIAREVFTNCKVNDVVAYYPKLKQGHNISYETIAIVPVHVLQRLRPILNPNHPCRYFTFTVHKCSKEEVVNHANTRNLINMLENNCDEFSSLDECCKNLNSNDRVLILSVERKPSLLGNMIHKQNVLRSRAKDLKKEMETMLTQVQIRLDAVKNRGDDYQEVVFDFDDDDDDEEEEDEDEDEDENKDEDKEDDKDSDTKTEDKSKTETNTESKSNTESNTESKTDSNTDDPSKPENMELCDTGSIFNTADVDKSSDMKMLVPKFKLLTFDEINRCNDVQLLTDYEVKLKGELSRINSLYRNLKIVNCSYYGLLGSDYGALSGRLVAAALTTLGRKYIIDMARFAHVQNFKAVLIDTDSVFVHNGDSNLENNPLPEFCKTLNEELELTAKMYQFIFIMAKKVYLAKCKGEWISRGINKNGPTIWNDVIFTLAERYLIERVPISSKMLQDILVNEVYMYIAERARKDRSVVLCMMSTNREKVDTANTPIAKMMRAVVEDEPDYIFGEKQVKYFHYLKNKPTDVIFEAAHHLNDVHISQLNLYKFVSKINTTIYQILSKAIYDANVKERGVHATITMAEYNIDSMAAFLRVNEIMKGWED